MYQITRDELLLMIKKETNQGFKRILNNHLRAMDDLPPVCLPCNVDEPEMPVQELLEVVEDEGVEDGNE